METQTLRAGIWGRERKPHTLIFAGFKSSKFGRRLNHSQAQANIFKSLLSVTSQVLLVKDVTAFKGDIKEDRPHQ